MKRWIAAVVALAMIGTGLAGAAWEVPPFHPLQLELHDAVIPVPDNFKQNICKIYYRNILEECLNTVQEAGDYVFDQGFFLKFPHVIPEEDCALMAKVLKENGEKSDKYVYKNFNNMHNCNFKAYGLERYVEKSASESGFVVQMPQTLERVVLNSEQYSLFRRNTYVTRPVYSLLHTRMKIEYGSHLEAGSGYICTYNRFKGKWVLEGECSLAWVS